MAIVKFQLHNRKEYAQNQFEHCFNLIKSVCNNNTKCLLLNTKYYKIYLTVEKYSIEDGGCAQCKEQYSSIDIYGLTYNLVKEEPYANLIMKYECNISQFYICCLCNCNEAEIETIQVESAATTDEDEAILTYDLLFKFSAEHHLFPQYVPSQDEIQVSKWPFAPFKKCLK
jgi:hypothetical protein